MSFQSSPMLETIFFVKMARQGVDFDAIIEKNIEEKEAELLESIDELKGKLFEKQEEVKKLQTDLLKDVVAIDVFEAANFQKENIQQTMEAITPLISEMEEKLTVSEKGLERMQMGTVLLTRELGNLTLQLKKSKGKYYGFQAPLNEFGNRLADYNHKSRTS